MAQAPTPTPALETLIGHDGARLALYRWWAEEPVGALILVHGYGEHARRHQELARSAQEAGLDVFAFDLRGHGGSPGLRGSVPGFAPLLNDIHEMFRLARAEDPDQPVLLFGHSMGGALALRYALDHPEDVRALCVSSPFLKDAAKRPAWLTGVSGIVARLLPNLPVAKLDPGLISRDPEEVERYRSDPLIYHGDVRAAAGYAMLEEGRALRRRAAELSVPTLIIVGTADGIADPEGSREFAAANPKVRLEEVAGGYHELHHDDPATGAPQRFRELVSRWLQANTRNTKSFK